MRRPVAVLLAIMVAGAAGLAIAALGSEHSQAFTLGVPRSAPIKLKAGRTACQGPISVPADAAFDGVTFAIGTGFRRGPQLDVEARDQSAGGPVLARGTLTAGYPDVADAPEHTVWFARVPAGRNIAVCITNAGSRAAYVYGAADAAARTSTGTIDGEPLGADFALDFDRRTSRSFAVLLPAMFDRVALFRAGWVGSWTFVLLGLVAALVVPALLVASLSAIGRSARATGTPESGPDAR